jgi:hypothetical protein
MEIKSMIAFVRRRLTGSHLIALFAAAIWTAPALPAHGAPNVAVLQPVQVRGVSFRSAVGVPSPVYFTDGVAMETVDWVIDALRIAWEEAPSITGLPHPGDTIPLYVFRDPEEAEVLAPRLDQSAPPFGACSSANDGDRALKCNATTLYSWNRTVEVITHEFTHQLVQGDINEFRGVGTWYNEGLAEYVQSTILSAHGPAYAQRAWQSREREAAAALGSGAYLHLTDVATNEQWVDLGSVAGPRLQYAESALAIRTLVTNFGMPKVTEVVRRTDPRHPFSQVFAEVFGESVEQFDSAFEASLGAELLHPGRVLYQDDFADPESGWSRESPTPDKSQLGYVDGGYRIAQLAGCENCGTLAMAPLAVDDFLAELEGQLVGPSDGGYLFMDFCMREDGSRYRFAVDPNDQRFWLRYRLGSEWTMVIPSTMTTTIEPGTALNRLGVRVHGSDLRLTVNGDDVASLDGTTFGDGRLAIGVGNQEDGAAEALFTNVVVTSVH